MRVFADASDQNGVGGEVFEHTLIGVAAVDEHAKCAVQAFGLELVKDCERDLIEVALLHGFPILRPFLFGFVLSGFSGSGGVHKINGDHSHFAVLVWKSRGELYHALRPDKVDIEGWPQGIFPIGGPRDELTCFTQDGVVQSDDKRGLCPVEDFHVGADALEEDLRMNTLLGVEIIISRPIGKLSTIGGDQRGDRVAARTKQLREQMVPVPLDAGGSAGRPGTELGPQRLPVVYEWRSFFLTVTGEGGT